MTTQPDIIYTAPTATDAGRQWVTHWLRDNPGWHHAAAICRAAGQIDNEDGKRHIRRLASESPQVLSGQRGYCHLDHADVEEMSHAANWLEHQAKIMGDRAARIRRASHARLASSPLSHDKN